MDLGIGLWTWTWIVTISLIIDSLVMSHSGVNLIIILKRHGTLSFLMSLDELLLAGNGSLRVFVSLLLSVVWRCQIIILTRLDSQVVLIKLMFRYIFINIPDQVVVMFDCVLLRLIFSSDTIII